MRFWLFFIKLATLLAAPYLHAENSTEPKFYGDVPHYIEQAEAAGIQHAYTGPWEYFVGGGISTFDCNQDRLPDLYIAGGKSPAKLYVNQSQPGADLRFEVVDSSSLSLSNVLGSYPIDINNDGFLDLIVLRVGENYLYQGGANCEFTRANGQWNFNGGNAWSTAFSATFEADATFPTLAIGNYVDRSAPGSPWGTCEDNELYRPASADKPSYQDKQLLTPGHCALSMIFSDWNKTGRDALRITNDRHYYRGGQDQLWRLDSGRYPRQYTQSEGWQPLVIWGMGLAEADINADGYPEYAITSMGDTKLQVLDVDQAIDEGRPVYTDAAWERGVTAHRPYTGEDIKPSTGWHAEFDDVNNDGHLDLFIAKGNVESMPDFAQYDPDNLLLGSASGRYFEKGNVAGIALDTRGRGASLEDFNADGMLDLIVINRNDNVSVFRNQGMQSDSGTRLGGNWLKLEIKQSKRPNRHAVGANVSIKTGNKVQSRRVQIGGGHVSGASGFLHVGLGVAERATVRVQWPDGQWSAGYKLFANQHVIIEREQTTPMQWFPMETND